MFPRINYNKYKKLIIVLLASCLYACGGGGDDNPVPIGAKLVLSPVSISWDIPQDPECSDGDPTTPAAFAQKYNDSYIQIAALDADDRPLGDIEIMVSLDLADNTLGYFTPVLKLYEDSNSNGVVDDPEELVSNVGDPVYITRTDEFSGVKNLIVRVNLACPYKGNLNVFTNGPAASQLNISVTES